MFSTLSVILKEIPGYACSRSAQVSQATNVCLWANRKISFHPEGLKSCGTFNFVQVVGLEVITVDLMFKKVVSYLSEIKNTDLSHAELVRWPALSGGVCLASFPGTSSPVT